jgi:predicted acyltransferase
MKQRLVLIDVFRGITVILMTIVNNPGDWDHLYSQLEHAEWHGCTLTDLVFPFFLFIVGVSLVLSDTSFPMTSPDYYFKTLTRFLRIFGLGLFLNVFSKINFWGLSGYSLLATRLLFTALVTIILLGDYRSKFKFYSAFVVIVVLFVMVFGGFDGYENIRIPGVLQRIALVYLIVSFLYKKFSTKATLCIGLGILIAYWGLMTLLPVPDFGVPNLNKATNLAAWLDRAIMQGHLWAAAKTWDPEGILSTLPAISTAILGVLVGKVLLITPPSLKVVGQLSGMGLLAIGVGLGWHLVFPMNKALWTSSFVVFTGGLATLMVAFLYYIIEIRSSKSKVLPFVIFGANPIVVFFFSGIIPRALGMVEIPYKNHGSLGLPDFLYRAYIAPQFIDPKQASLAGAIIYLLIWASILLFFYRKSWFFKV